MGKVRLSDKQIAAADWDEIVAAFPLPSRLLMRLISLRASSEQKKDAAWILRQQARGRIARRMGEPVDDPDVDPLNYTSPFD